MASRRQSPAPKRILALKRADGEPLTRADIQYDVLKAIFSDRTVAFTNPYDTSEDGPPKLCFRDLYIKAIMNSSKATKALRDKMTESTAFAEDFAMLALLVNVGRINTTMSFFPEMKTTIRTYHPIPTLQRTSGNLQDAPRIKHILKMSLLEREVQDVPIKPGDIMDRARKGQIPSTSILNLMFVLSSHTAVVGSFFTQRFDFLDIFLRTEISSVSRAQAFLWICFNFLENPGSATDDYDEEEKPNPFSEPSKNAAPSLLSLTHQEAVLENVDTPEEKALAEKLVMNRDQIMKQNAAKEAGKDTKAEDNDQPIINDTEATKIKGKKIGGKNPDKPKRGGRANTDKSRKDKLKQDAKGSQNSTQGSTSRDDMSIDDDSNHHDTSHFQSVMVPRIVAIPDDDGHHTYRILPSSRGDMELKQRPGRRYSPYPEPTASHKSRTLRHFAPERTMLEHAWYIINNTDPLIDSDDERGDEHDRHDYIQRLKVISRLSGRQWDELPHAFHRNVELSGI